MKQFFDHFHEILENNVINFPETIALKAFRYARTGLPILLIGDTGVGKESMAEFIHKASGRVVGKFKAVNCAALAESLIETELFGICARVASSVGERLGLFEMAHDGTLFIDEIGDMPLSVQVKLLRLLSGDFFSDLGSQDNAVHTNFLPSNNITPINITRVGSTPYCECKQKPKELDHTNIPVNVRLVFATNKNLLDLVKEGKFREDFYYRISILTLKMPTLQERLSGLEDERKSLQLILNKAVKPLFNENVFSNSSVAMFNNLVKSKNLKELFKLLRKYDWPGNFRQLQQVLINATLIEMGHYTSSDPNNFKISEETFHKAYHNDTFLHKKNSSDEKRDLSIPVLSDQDVHMIKSYIQEEPFEWPDDGKNSSLLAFLCFLILSQNKEKFSYLKKRTVLKLSDLLSLSNKSTLFMNPSDSRGAFLKFLNNTNVKRCLVFNHEGGKKEYVIRLTKQHPNIEGFENILNEVNKLL